MIDKSPVQPSIRVTKEKARLRSAAKAVRDAIAPELRAEYSERIAEHVLRWERYRAAQTVFIYLSMGSEVETFRLARRMIAQGKTLCVPRVLDGERMEAALLREPLIMSRYGAPEPAPGVPAVDPACVDLALIPALAVSRGGTRLGYGGGYYDRYLASRAACRAALCFSAQTVDSLPSLGYDIPMDYAVTERGTICFGEECPL